MWQVRQILALAMLAVCAYTDIKEKSIYVMPLVITGTGAVIISLVSVLAESGEVAGKTMVDYMVLPAAAGISAVLLSRASGGHIGSGDALLLGVLGLVTGIKTDIVTFTAGLFAVSVYAMAVLVLPRKRRVKYIPFAPFVMTGYVLVLANEI